jgi:uncharacterized protein (DUF1800 family)
MGKMPSVPVYKGRFGVPEAERLLWRAGFGPRRGEARRVASLGLDGAVRWLTHPGAERFTGRPPVDEKGRRLAPADAYGHDHLWWLDRMVRTNRPLVERMTLVWHDWFATSNAGVGSQKLMLAQNRMLRKFALGNFRYLLHAVTADPAMLIWLSGVDNRKESPNENYARELMELFTLGEGNGYSERDVREQARALTGFRNEWREGRGHVNFRFDRERHDDGMKTVFGKRGRYDWRDSCDLCLRHPRHARFFVEKLWSYFIPTPPNAATRAGLEAVYRRGYEVRPVLQAILKHPALYNGPRMVKPPIVLNAGLLRALGRRIDTRAWVWLGEGAGQRLFYPPSVAGWDDERWLDTATFRARWAMANEALSSVTVERPKRGPAPKVPHQPSALVEAAYRTLAKPSVRPQSRAAITKFVKRALSDADADWEKDAYPLLVMNAARQLIAVSPDYQAV